MLYILHLRGFIFANFPFGLRCLILISLSLLKMVLLNAHDFSDRIHSNMKCALIDELTNAPKVIVNR